jgi:hypothetical protein
MKPCWNDSDRKEQKLSEDDMYQLHIFDHKSHMDWPDIEPQSPS